MLSFSGMLQLQMYDVFCVCVWMSEWKGRACSTELLRIGCQVGTTCGKIPYTLGSHSRVSIRTNGSVTFLQNRSEVAQ